MCLLSFLDTEAPVCGSCPADIIIHNATVSEIRVNWQIPQCTDNSGVPPKYDSNRQPGTKFQVPGQYEVKYTLEDDAGNKNEDCKFRIDLKGKCFWNSQHGIHQEIE